MTKENAKLFLLCHRNNINDINQIQKLGKTLHYEASIERKKSQPTPTSKKGPRFVDFVPPRDLPTKRLRIPLKTLNTEKVPSDSTSSTEVDSSSTSEYERKEQNTLKRSRKKVPKKEIISPEVVQALDRCQISSQQAMMVLSPSLAASDLKVEDVNISRATIARRRRKFRVSISTDIRDSFHHCDTLLCVHYDEKKMEDHSNEAVARHVNRLAIAVSSMEGCKLISVPKIENGLGKTIADSVLTNLNEWNLSDKVRALCFDTTAANTGVRTGSAKVIANAIPNFVLFCACRHHIAELLLAKAFELTVEPVSAAPNISLFQRFRNAWPRMKVDFEQIQRNSSINDPAIKQFFPNEIRTELIQYAQKQMDAHHDRADYKELVHLVLLFLGEIPLDKKGKPLKIKAAGAVSRARFMGKGIYSLKIYLFRDQFLLTGE